MSMTLTRASFFEKTKIRCELVKDVPEFGDVWIRDASEVKRIARSGQLFNGRAQRVPEEYARRRLYEIIDQVCVDDKGTPMFTDEDLPQLEQTASIKLDGIIGAIQIFNSAAEKKSEDESSD